MPTPAPPADRPAVTAMDRVQDRPDRPEPRIGEPVVGHPDSFAGAETDEATEAHRATYELLGDAPPEPVPNERDDPEGAPSLLRRLFLAPEPEDGPPDGGGAGPAGR